MIAQATQILRWIVPALALAALTGCENVKPWQRKALADYTMRADRDPLAIMQEEHIYFSREAATGGRGVGGGGCGCN
jgi:predicted aminopeptidase